MAEWGPCPPGSLMERQELGFDVRSASAVRVATDECGGTPPDACTSASWSAIGNRSGLIYMFAMMVGVVSTGGPFGISRS